MQNNFAIDGSGRISQRHAEQISRVGNVKAVCDIIPVRANILASQYNAIAYYSLRQLGAADKNIDIISICTQNTLHAEQDIQSLQSGMHVIYEKALCIRSADGTKKINAAEDVSKKLFVVKSTRFTCKYNFF